MDNLLSYCGLVDTRISASEKDLPVAMGSMRSLKCPVGSLGVGDLGVSESQGD